MQFPISDWLVPDWPAPPTVRAVCTTRSGGQSQGVYAAMNLGIHVGDDPHHVAANRRTLQAALGRRAVFLDQVHGTEVQEVGADTADGMTADAALTSGTDVACTVMVADCLPVLFCDARGGRVAAAHAGWRGLLGTQGRGVLDASVDAFGGTGTSFAPVMAWLGPCIGPKAFEVGNEVREAFVAQSAQAASCFEPASPGKWLADLPALARQRLSAMGITHVFGNDGSDVWCTVANPSRFFSHRRDRVSGRMAVCIWRVG